MSKNPRAWWIGGLLLVALIGVAGWMFLVKPVFAAVSDTRQQTVATDAEADKVTAQTKQLAQQAEDLEAQIAALMRIRAKIPKDVNVPKLMRTIQAEARMEGVSLDSLQPGQITLFQVTVAPEDTSGTTPGASPSKPAAPTPAPTNLGQGVAPKNTGVAYVPLTLSGQGTYGAIRRLTARLEQQQRAFLVTTLDVARQSDGDADAPLEFTMQARVFVLNGDEVDLPAKLRPGGD